MDRRYMRSMQKKVRFINNYCLKTIEHKVLYEPNSAILSLTKLGRTIFLFMKVQKMSS